MRILLIEDDVRLGFMIHYKLVAGGYQVDWAKHSEEAEDFLTAGTYDLYIFDWMLPGKTGLELCKQQRDRQDTTAILMLTARDAVEDRVNGLMQGADDYLVKPFAFEELFARIIALDRRKQTAGYNQTYSLGDLSLNPQTQEVIRGGVQIHLTKREFQLLTCLMRHSGEILSRERILNYVWGSLAEVTSNAVDAIVKLLRKKLDDPFDVKMLQSVHGQGYRLVDGQDEPHD